MLLKRKPIAFLVNASVPLELLKFSKSERINQNFNKNYKTSESKTKTMRDSLETNFVILWALFNYKRGILLTNVDLKRDYFLSDLKKQNDMKSF